MRKIYLFGVLITALYSCATRSDSQRFRLTESGLFHADSVQLYLAQASLDASDSSQKIFLSGIDLLKNHNKATESIGIFLRALSIYPNAKAYYELGNALLESGDAAKALQSFRMAEKLDYMPLGNVLFKQACCFAVLNDDRMYEYVTYAVQNGFVDRAQVFNNRYFSPNDPSLSWHFNEAMKGNGDPDIILWQGYSRGFETLSLPLTIDTGSFRSLGEPVYISYDYDKFVTEMRDNRFSRDVGNDFFYFGQVSITPTVKLLIYGCQSYEQSGAPVYYTMVSFDNKGKVLDKQMVAGARTFDDPVKVLSMTSNRFFEIMEYENRFEKDPEQFGYESNTILDRRLVGSTRYLVNEQGRFVASAQAGLAQ